MDELKRTLPGGSELIWSSVSSRIHRWSPDNAILLDVWDEDSLCYPSHSTHVEMFAAENGSVVLKRTSGSPDRVEYWVHSSDSPESLRVLLEREQAGTLGQVGTKLLEEYASRLGLA